VLLKNLCKVYCAAFKDVDGGFFVVCVYVSDVFIIVKDINCKSIFCRINDPIFFDTCF